jgi:hypothetical protein
MTLVIERDSEKLAPAGTLSISNKVPGTHPVNTLGYTEQPLAQVPSQVVAENDNDTEEGNYNSQVSSESDDN